MKTPDWITMEDVVITFGRHKDATLPAGSFVKPLEYYNLPRHTKEDLEQGFWPKEAYGQKFMCYYTHFGITVIGMEKVRPI